MAEGGDGTAWDEMKETQKGRKRRKSEEKREDGRRRGGGRRANDAGGLSGKKKQALKSSSSRVNVNSERTWLWVHFLCVNTEPQRKLIGNC